MRQSKALSFCETCFSTAFGFAINLAVQRTVFPWFGFTPPLAENVAISAIFTVTSVCRGYIVRRLFDWWHHRG